MDVPDVYLVAGMTPQADVHCAAAEMADLREAVKELRGAINALAANADLAQDKILKTNLRDARGSAALRVQQLSTSTTSSMVGSRTAHPLRAPNNTSLHGSVASLCAPHNHV